MLLCWRGTSRASTVALCHSFGQPIDRMNNQILFLKGIQVAPNIRYVLFLVLQSGWQLSDADVYRCGSFSHVLTYTHRYIIFCLFARSQHTILGYRTLRESDMLSQYMWAFIVGLYFFGTKKNNFCLLNKVLSQYSKNLQRNNNRIKL